MKEALELDKNETILMRVRKSYFGLVPFAIFFGLAVTLLFGGFYGLGRYEENLSEYGSMEMYIGIIIALTVLFAVVAYVGLVIYLNNKIIITNESVVQVLQRGLFSRKISQLSLARVEDVTVDQHGILAHMFHYGTLRIETAGEQMNFIFTMAYSPYKAAEIIIEAQERLQEEGNTGRN